MLFPLMIRRGRAAVGLSLSFALLSNGPAAAAPDQGFDGVARSSIYVPVRDGIKLAVNIYRPTQKGLATATRYPVVFAFTPYRARYFDKNHKIVETADEAIFGLRKLTQAGYVVAVADIRGKGASFGARRGFLDQTEARDGYDIVEYLAHQPYTTGKVGITGCSYLGGSAMLVASALPPSLKAVFSAATDIDKYAFVRQGGITAQFNTRPDEAPDVDLASVPVDGDTDGAMLKAAVAEHARNTPMAELWASMPYRDSISSLTRSRFWEEVGPYTHMKALRSPKLAWYFWGNWNDEPTEQMIQAAANIKSHFIAGPGSHCIAPKQFDITLEQKNFFDHYLKGVDNGFDREPPYTWWREQPDGKGTLVHSRSLPGSGIARTSLYLSNSHNDAPAAFDTGSLAKRPGVAAKTPFRVQYDVSDSEYFRFWPKLPDGNGATFTSAPLATDAEIEGYPVVHLTVSLDASDADVFAYLEDVDGSGQATVLSHGRLAASHRKISVAPYNHLGLPYHSGLKADVSPVTPDRPVSLAFALSPRAYTVAAGHRLRVTVAGADSRQRNIAAIRNGLAKTITIDSGGNTDPTRIDIPFKTPVAFR